MDTISNIINLMTLKKIHSLTNFTMLSSNSITIPAFQNSGIITLSSTDDSAFESEETILADIDTVNNAIEKDSQQAAMTIIDDDLPTVSFASASSASTLESGLMTISCLCR